MKYLSLLSLCLFMAFLTSCDPVEPPVEPLAFDYTGEITGHDLAFCACCGGLIITIEDSALDYRIKEYPGAFTSALETGEFPISVNFNYTPMDTCTSIYFIAIDEIELVE